MKRSIKDFFSVAKKSEEVRSGIKESVSFLEYVKETLIISGIILFSFILIGFFMGTMKNFIYVFIMITVLIGSSFLLLRIRFEKYVMNKNNVVYDIVPIIIIDMLMLSTIWFVSNSIVMVFYMFYFVNIWFIIIVVFLGLSSYTLSRIYLLRVGDVDIENNNTSKLLQSIFMMVVFYIGLIYILPSMEVGIYYVVATLVVVMFYMIRMLLQSVVNLDTNNFSLVKGFLFALAIFAAFSSYNINDYDDVPRIPPFKQHVNKQSDFDVDKISYYYIEHDGYYFSGSRVLDEDYNIVHQYETYYVFKELEDEVYAFRDTRSLSDNGEIVYELYKVEEDFSLTYILDTVKFYNDTEMIQIDGTWYSVTLGNRGLSDFYSMDLNSEFNRYTAPFGDNILSVSDESIIFILDDELHAYTNSSNRLYTRREPYYMFSKMYFVRLDINDTHTIELITYDQLINDEVGIKYTREDINFYYDINTFRVIDDILYIQTETEDNHNAVITFNKDLSVREELLFYQQSAMYYNFISYGDELIVYLDIQDEDNYAYTLDYEDIGIYVNSSQTRFIHEGVILVVFGLVFFRRKPVMNFKRGGRI